MPTRRLRGGLFRPLVRPWFSKLGEKVLDSRISLVIIPGFIRRRHISFEDYEPKDYHSYNDFLRGKFVTRQDQLTGGRNILENPYDGSWGIVGWKD